MDRYRYTIYFNGTAQPFEIDLDTDELLKHFIGYIKRQQASGYGFVYEKGSLTQVFNYESIAYLTAHPVKALLESFGK